MRNITKIFIVVLSLILLFAVSCSNDDKTGVANNPPENDTEITDGGTGSGGTGTGGDSGSGTGTGGDSGSGTGTGGDSGSGSGSGSGEVTPPSEPETTEEGYFPPPEGKYKDDTLYSMYGESGYTKVSTITEKGIQKTKIEGTWLLIKDDGTKSGQRHSPSIEKWKKTTKGGNPIKLEGEYYSEPNGGKYTIIYDYASETLSCTFTKDSGEKYLFNGKKIS